MATPSQVKSGLDDIAHTIAKNRERMLGIKSTATEVSQSLDLLASTHADVVNTISAYPANSTDYFERTAKDSLTKLTNEFVALKADADAVAAADLN